MRGKTFVRKKERKENYIRDQKQNKQKQTKKQTNRK